MTATGTKRASPLRALARSLFGRRWGLNVFVPLLAATLVGLAALAGRSGTLAGVRFVDQALIEDLVRATMSVGESGEASRKPLKSAIERLHQADLPHAYIGIAIWRGEDQIAVNHKLLKDKSFEQIAELAKSHATYQAKTLGPDASGVTWRIAYFRSELAYNASDPWQVWVPVQLLFDEYNMESSRSAFLRRGGPPFVIAFGVVFCILRIWEWVAGRRARTARNRIAELEEQALAARAEADDRRRLLSEAERRISQEEKIRSELGSVLKTAQERLSIAEDESSRKIAREAYDLALKRQREADARATQAERERGEASKAALNSARRSEELERRLGQIARSTERGGSETTLPSLESENFQLRTRLAKKEGQLSRMRAEYESLDKRLAYSEGRLPTTSAAPEIVEPPKTLADAFLEAEEQAGDRLLYGGDVYAGLKVLGSDAAPPAKVYKWLMLLAEMTSVRRRGDLGSSPELWLRNRGCEASGESDTTRNSAHERAKRTWDAGGKRRTFDLHMKPGHNIRIYFVWDENRQKNVVGWVGKHLKCAALRGRRRRHPAAR